MAGNQDYQSQLEALRELASHLQHITNEAQNVMRSYAAKVTGLVGSGLPMQVHDKMMSEFYMQSQNLTTQSCAIISDQAFPYVRNQIQGLEQLLGR